MTPVKPTAKPHIMDIPPYIPGKHSIASRDDVVILSSNENPMGCSPLVAHCLANMAYHRYPNGGSNRLISAIAKIHALDSSRIICGAGSDEILQILTLAYVGTGDEVIYTQHGFLMYPIQTRIAGGTPVQVPETNYTVNVDNILKGITVHTKMIMLANPANPTGTVISRGEIIRLIENTPPHILIVLDGAYAEYCTQDVYADGGDLVNMYQNVVMTRTFSKVYGLASVRLGWGYAHSDIIDTLHRVRGPFNVNSFAQTAGISAVNDQKFIADCVLHNTKWRTILRESFIQKGCVVPKSHTNFILVVLPTQRHAQNLIQLFENNGILVRSVAGYGILGGVRITIGTESENQKILTVLQIWDYHE